MSKFYLHTFGCRCNQADSAAMRESLCRRSFDETGNPRDAELVIINTCTVTRSADQQARQTIRKLNRENPSARIVVAGCYAERAPQALAALPGVSLVLGNAKRQLMADAVTAPADAGRVGILHSSIMDETDCPVEPMSRTGGKTRPFIKLQDGCDARCSYCIVPFVRGPSRSATPEDILREASALVDAGYQELVLTGVHLGTYGRKLAQTVTLADLLRKILEIPGLGRLRVSSIEPMRFTRGIVRLASEYPAFAPHFHIPLQSGSDRILRRMRRPYTAKRFLELLDFIRERLPGAALGTDVMVGFPGETDEDFGQTREVIQKSPLTYLHVFPFSSREGTDAYGMGQKVHPLVISRRARALREISQTRNLEFRRRFLGSILPAIGLAKEESEGEGVALTENYIHVRTDQGQVQANRLLRVRIDRVTAEGTLGSPV